MPLQNFLDKIITGSRSVFDIHKITHMFFLVMQRGVRHTIAGSTWHSIEFQEKNPAGLWKETGRPTAILERCVTVGTGWSCSPGIKGSRICSSLPLSWETSKWNSYQIQYARENTSISDRKRSNFKEGKQQIMAHFVLTSKCNLQQWARDVQTFVRINH
jgi:hypothetical protein